MTNQIWALVVLSSNPFIDALALARITGRQRSEVHHELEALVQANLAGRVKHSTPFLPETARYYVTATGIAAASAALGYKTPYAYARAYPMSREWMRMFIERIDGTASVYALAAAMSTDAGGTHIEFHRKGILDAVLTLCDGRTFGVMRRGRALRPKSWRDRVMHFWHAGQNVDEMLFLVPSPWERSMVVRWGTEAVVPAGYIAAEAPAALTDPNRHVWKPAEGGEETTLASIVAQTEASDRCPAASPARKRSTVPDPDRMVQAPTFGMSWHDKMAFSIITAHPMIRRRHLLDLLTISDGGLTQVLRRLQDRWGLVERHGRRRDYRVALSPDGIQYITKRDRVTLATTRKAWSTGPPNDPASTAPYHGSLINTWAARPEHTDGITWWLSRLAAEARNRADSGLVWWVPEAWTLRPFDWRENAISPDAVGELVTDDAVVHFCLEYERRARNPAGIVRRLRPYRAYYTSTETGGDLPTWPLALFFVDTERVAETYVATARAEDTLRLPILVSSMPDLAKHGILGRTWRPLWAPATPQTMTLADAAGHRWNRIAQRMERP